MPVKKTYLKSYQSSREAGAFIDGLMAGWSANDVESVEEDNPKSRWGVEYVVYKLTITPDPVPAPPRRKFVR